jgi:hypothetical protein
MCAVVNKVAKNLESKEEGAVKKSVRMAGN